MSKQDRAGIFHSQWKCCCPGITNPNAQREQTAVINEESIPDVRGSVCLTGERHNSKQNKKNPTLCPLARLRGQIHLARVILSFALAARECQAAQLRMAAVQEKHVARQRALASPNMGSNFDFTTD